MLKDLKLAIWSAAVASASFSPAGAFGYGAVVAIAAALLSALGRVLRGSLFQIERGGDHFKRRDLQAARRHSERTFNPLRLLASNMAHAKNMALSKNVALSKNMALPNRTSSSREHCDVQT